MYIELFFILIFIVDIKEKYTYKWKYLISCLPLENSLSWLKF